MEIKPESIIRLAAYFSMKYLGQTKLLSGNLCRRQPLVPTNNFLMKPFFFADTKTLRLEGVDCTGDTYDFPKTIKLENAYGEDFGIEGSMALRIPPSDYDIVWEASRSAGEEDGWAFMDMSVPNQITKLNSFFLSKPYFFEDYKIIYEIDSNEEDYLEFPLDYLLNIKKSFCGDHSSRMEYFLENAEKHFGAKALANNKSLHSP